MDKIILCREVENSDKEELYYKIPQEYLENVEEMQFVYFIKKELGCKKVSFAQIVKIYNSLNFNKKVEIHTLKEQEMIYLVSKEFIFYPILEDCILNSISEINQIFTLMIKELSYEIKKARMQPVLDIRKKYLLSLFWDEEQEEFDLRSKRFKNTWLKRFNGFDLDFVHIINLYILKEKIHKLIDLDQTESEKERRFLKDKFTDKIKNMSISINKKGNARYQMDGYISIITSFDGQDIVFGMMSPLEFHLNFFWFWNIIKNLLTVSYIPTIILLLESDKKIIIYLLLGLVYLITLILSDEKQTNRIIEFINKSRQEQNNGTYYNDLFYIGMIILLMFIFLTIQIICIANITQEIKLFFMYLIADYLLALITLVGIIFLLSLLFWGITLFTSTIFYITKFKKLRCFCIFGFKQIFLLLSLACLYNVLKLNENINNLQPQTWKIIIFSLSGFLCLSKISESFEEFKSRIKR